MDNKNSTVLSQLSSYLFWDVDTRNLDIDASRAYVIQRVLEYGQLEDWQLIRRYYGLDTIVEVCKQLRTLDPRALSFITTISHTDIHDYRCYHFSQSNPTLWNS